MFKPKDIDKTKYQYAKVSVWSRNKEYAKRKATRYVNLLLDFISYDKTFKRPTNRLWGPSKPLFELELIYIFIFKNNVYSTNCYFEDTSIATEFYDLDDYNIKNLKLMLTQFNSAYLKTQDIINNSMKQYHLGLKEKVISSSFLSFWTSLEILTLKKRVYHIMK